MPSTIPYTKPATDRERLLSGLKNQLGRLGAFAAADEYLDEQQARSRKRYARAIKNGATSVFAKVIVLASAIISVPLTLRYLGNERYGLWMTITSVVIFLGFADFGIGNGLTASIAKADGLDSREAARREVSCGFYLLLVVGTVLAACFLAFYHAVSWSALYGTHTSLASAEAGPATGVLVLCTALSMPLGTVLRIQLGYQEGYLGDLWNAGGNVLALGGIVLSTHLHGGLPLLVLAVAGAPVLATTANCLLQFTIVRPWLRPSLALFDLRTALHLAAVGGLFFLQQCFGLIYYVSDNIVISRMMGAEHVAHYAVLQRIFSIGLVAQYFMIPLWPAIAEAVARGDFEWARRSARRAVGFSILVGLICGSVLLVLSRSLMKRWSGVDLGPIDTLRMGFAVWVVLVGFIAAMNAILNQPSTMKLHLVYFGSASIASLLLKITFAHYGSLAGVIWSTTIAFVLIYVIPTSRLALRSMHAEGGMLA